ncbi:uncharacterized protein E0L32_003022 [Thyridium curvatum]|uniref:Uncharacterized protein n=1 Tax=Thyridium curvatum TaxID=1093900 RepID=A0A507BIX6_9PEZI|nr:uncharacterized protein E0L32_003022 [Thyridium curvatum]TPX17379.1 hypothetical protein E0L32_003022 [Thyridium curvatum]
MSNSQFDLDHRVPVTDQDFPGKESEMPNPTPQFQQISTSQGGVQDYQAAGKLKGKKAIITGGDSGIGRATAILFAMEGADSLIAYLPEEEEDAQESKKQVEKHGQKCYLIATDLTDRGNCKKVIDKALEVFGGSIDILFNNAAYQMMVEDIKDLSEEQWIHTFNVNIHPFFYLSKYALPHMNEGSTIINNASINAYVGRPDLLDYTSTKGAIVSFTRGLSNQYVGKGIRVNAVAPGPVWTPLIPATMNEKAQKQFTSPMGRPAQPSEIATCVVFLASRDSAAISGQTIHCNGEDADKQLSQQSQLSNPGTRQEPQQLPWRMMDESNSNAVELHPTVGAAGVILVALLTIPALLQAWRSCRSSSRIRLSRGGGYQTLSPVPAAPAVYESEDGQATAESVSEFSDREARTAAWISIVVGLGASIASGVLLQRNPTGDGGSPPAWKLVSYWAEVPAWTLLLIQCASLPVKAQYDARFKLVIVGLVSTLSLLLSITARLGLVTIRALPWSYRHWRASHDGEPLAIALCWLLEHLAALSAVLAFASFPHRPDVYHKGTLVDQQHAVSLLTRLAFSWNRLVFEISRERQLNLEDLPILDSNTRSRNVTERYLRSHPDGGDKPRLWRQLLHAYRYELAMQWALTAVTALLALFPQYVLYHFLESLEDQPQGGKERMSLWVWVVGLAVALLLQVWVGNSMRWLTSSKLEAPLLSLLQSLVFQKALRLDEAADPGKKVQDKDDGEDKDAAGKAKKDDKKKESKAGGGDVRQSVVNHMKLDSGRVIIFPSYNFWFPLAIFKLVLAGSFLIQLLGWRAFFAGFLSAIVVLPISYLMSKKYGAIQFGLMKYRDEKAHILTEALQGMRQIKYSALETLWEKKILKSRDEELKQYWIVNLWMCFMIMIINLGPLLLASISLTVYTITSPTVRASVIFSSLGLFDQLDEAIGLLPMIQVYMMEAWTSCVRLEKYLSQPDKAPVSLPGDNIVFDNATVRWPKVDESKDQEQAVDEQETRSILRNVTLEFPRGELSVIAGKTGAGKSLLLAAILGEVKLLSGSIKIPAVPPALEIEADEVPEADWIIPSLTSFVSQTPWIETGTVQENITFGMPFNEARYQKVLRTCALEKDIELLVDGDKTEVGPKGVTLSGGQRWRVALARALYSRAGILILDDVLSAVDAHVGRIIVDEALTGDLAQGRTRILATHHAEMCLPRASYVVRLQNGALESAEKLTPKDSDLSESIAESSTAVSTSDDTVLGSQDDQAKDTSIEERKKSKKSDDEEKREVGRVKWRIYAIYIAASASILLWVLAIAFILGSRFLTVWRTWSLKKLAESYSTEGVSMFFSGLHTQTFSNEAQMYLHHPAMDITRMEQERSVRFWMIAYIVISFSNVFLVVARQYTFIMIGLRASRVLFERMTHAILRAPLRWVDTVPSGRILNRFTSDTFTVDRRLSGELGGLISNNFSIIVIIASSFVVSKWVIVCGAVLLIFYAGVAKTYITAAREVKRINSVSSSPIYDQFSSVLSGLSTIRAFHRTDFYMDRMYGLIDNGAKATWALQLCSRWMSFRMGMLGAVFVTAVAVAVALGGVGPALAGFGLTFALGYSAALTQLLTNMTSVELGFNAAERVIEYSEIETEPESGIEAPAAWPARGEIEVDNLTVSYGDDLPPVLKNLHFDVKAGERIGIVGRTGAGKSTLAAVFFRLLEPKEGTVSIDGINIATLKLSQLRSRLAIIPQDPFLFSGTLRSNLDMEEVKDDYELQTVLQRVHLIEPQTGDPQRPSAYAPADDTAGQGSVEDAIAEEILAAPDPASATGVTSTADGADEGVEAVAVNTEVEANTPTTSSDANDTSSSSSTFKDLSTPISAGGANLSQGQRQLVCLARAILARPKVVVLDEATSAVDRGTDAAIQDSLRQEFAAGGCTVLVIAHRLSTVADFDRLLVLKEGRVAEFGTPKELLQRGMEKASRREGGGEQEAEEGDGEGDEDVGAFWELVQRSAEKDKLVEMILG